MTIMISSDDELRQRIIGLGEQSLRKSYYPELRRRLDELERFRALLDQSNDAILLLKLPEARIADLSEAACRILGRTRKDLLGGIADEVAADVARIVRETAEGKPCVVELGTAGGPRVDVEAQWSEVTFGPSAYAVVVARDVTERLRAERALHLSEARFRAVFSAAAVGIALLDETGRLREANAAFRDLVGLCPEELSRLTFDDLTPECDRPEMHRRMDDLRQGHTDSVRRERPLLRRDGTELRVLLNASLFTEGDGRANQFIVAVQDVTRRRRAEDALRFLSLTGARLGASLDLRETIATVVNLAVGPLGSLVALYLLRDDGSIELADAASVELRGNLVEDLRRDADAGNEEPVVRRCFETGKAQAIHVGEAGTAGEPEQGVMSTFRSLGARVVSVMPLSWGGRTRGALLLAGRAPGHERVDPIAQEIAEEFARRVSAALHNAHLFEDAQAANRVKDEFLAVVSHELRTPLTAILGWATLLGSGKGPQLDVARASEVIGRNARSLARIIDDLLEVSRTAAGKVHLELGTVDLAALVEATAESLRPAALARGVSMKVRTEPMPAFLGDAERLQQVVWNLISNAVKFTPSGGCIEILAESKGGAPRLTVRDTGRGIEPEFLPHVFERFRQADSSSSRQSGGLGLGLSIVKHLIELHGGKVHAESAGKGFGATFVVDLPPSWADGIRPIPPPRVAPPSLVGIRVLVIDDDADARELVAELLSREGAQVAVAAEMAEALASLEEQPPEVLISDLAMPGCDGFALLQAIRRRAFTCPALALTAMTRAEDERRARAAGFDSFLSKPIDPARLPRVVFELASRFRGKTVAAGKS